MISLRGNCTNRSLWFAAVGSFALILCVGVVVGGAPAEVTICHNGSNLTESTATRLGTRQPRRHAQRLRHCVRLPTHIDPVTCRSNGRTYVNLCIAVCDGATGCSPALRLPAHD